MIGIGIIGVGGIADNVHIPGINEAEGGQLVAICDTDKKRLNEIGDKYNIPQNRRFENYLDLIACSEVDAVEVCTPNYLHVPMAQAAAKARKPINVEKPLSTNLTEAKKLGDTLLENSVPNMMCFSYRFKPAVRYAKEILNRGLLGDILSVNVEYLKSSAFWSDRRLDWRFIKEYAGTGVLGDLGVHLIDMAQFLVGDMTRVCAEAGIVVKQRKRLDSDELGNVETDDYCNFMADFDCGAHGMFTITRCAIGHDNTIKYDIFGTKGVISFNLNDPTVLGVCVGEIDLKAGGLHTVKVPAEFNASQEQAFIDIALGRYKEEPADIKEGVRCQKILDAISKSSDENRWIEIK